MRKVLIPLAPGFEAIEAATVLGILGRVRADVTVAGESADPIAGTDKVSPRVGAVDEVLVRDTFLGELSRDGWSERMMAGIWERAGTAIVRRQEPVPTRAGKILPFHVA